MACAEPLHPHMLNWPQKKACARKFFLSLNPLALLPLALVVLLGGIYWQSHWRRASPLAMQSSSSHSPVSNPKLSQLDASTSARVNATYGKLPLSFEANHGQINNQVKFLSRGNGYNLFLTPTEAILQLQKRDAQQQKEKPTQPSVRPTTAKSDPPSTKLRMKLLNANPSPQVAGLEELPGKINYFLGQDPKQWRTNVPTYAKVRYQGVYPGVDLVYYGNQQQLEYDFIVAPGTSPNTIKLAFEGAERLEVDPNGDLVLDTTAGQIRQHKPVIYQEVNGVRQEIKGGYILSNVHQVGFQIGHYDTSRPLVIDPVLVYSTYVGIFGDQPFSPTNIAVDQDGSVYVTGSVSGVEVTPTEGVLLKPGRESDSFVLKLNPSGSALVYTTYFGGNRYDMSNSIAVDPYGEACITGWTNSTNFPTTPWAVQTNHGEDYYDAFVVKLSARGSEFVYSTYLGGRNYDTGYGIAVDADGNAYITGTTQSNNFPISSSSFQPTFTQHDPLETRAFITKLNPSGSALIYSTYLGGSGTSNSASSIAVDAMGQAYITGRTNSTDFPVTSGAFQSKYGGGYGDAYIVKLNAAGSNLLYSTFLGGSENETGFSITVDSTGHAYLTGETASPNFPTLRAIQPFFGGNSEFPVPPLSPNLDAFITKLEPDGSGLVFSTYLGAEDFDKGTGIALDASDNIYITGLTRSNYGFPMVNPLRATDFNLNAFVTKLNAAGSVIIYSTHLGGSSDDTGTGLAVDATGNAYVTGWTLSSDFPLQHPLQSTGPNFVTKIAEAANDAEPQPRSLQILPRTIFGDTIAQGRVSLTGLTDRDLTVTLSSSDPAIASVPASTVIPAGSSTVVFPITTHTVTQTTLVKIFVTVKGVTWEREIPITLPTLSFFEFKIQPEGIVSGESAQGIIQLYSPAPPEGALIVLSSSNPSYVEFPATVTIPPGERTATFPILTKPEAEVIISFFASYNGVTRPAPLFYLNLPLLTSLDLGAEGRDVFFITSGDSLDGRVLIDRPAPPGGFVVTLANDRPSLATVPSRVTIPAGAKSATFPITTRFSSESAWVTISTVHHGVRRRVILVVGPARFFPFHLTLEPRFLLRGESAQATVVLNDVAPAGGIVMQLAASYSAPNYPLPPSYQQSVTLPPTVTIPAGAKTASFTVQSNPAAEYVEGIISASYLGQTGGASFTVSPASVIISTVETPTYVLSGSTFQGKVRLNKPAPPEGAVITLTNNRPDAATLPQSVTIPAGYEEATFTVVAKELPDQAQCLVTASYHEVTRTTSFNVLPLTAALSSLTFGNGLPSGVGVLNGNSIEAIVNLTGSIPLGTVTIALTSSNPSAAEVPASVSVSAGWPSAKFYIRTHAVAKDTPVTISASYRGVTKSVTLTVLRAYVDLLTITPNQITADGPKPRGTVRLDSLAPPGGAVIEIISSNPSVAEGPATVVIPDGETFAFFPITTYPVAQPTTITISSLYQGLKSDELTVLPAVPISLTLNPTNVVGGSPLQGTITLNGPAATGTRVTLTSNLASAVELPNTIAFSPGATSATFPIITHPVTEQRGATISASSASVQDASVSSGFTILPATLTSLAITPSSVVGSQQVQGLVTLNGPAPPGGTLVTLASSNPTAASVPTSVIIPSGSTIVAFTITTQPVANPTTVTITASYLGTAKSAQIVIQPTGLSSLTFNPASVIGGHPSQGTITLNGPAPAGGALVTLEKITTLDSDFFSSSSLPRGVLVPAGATSADFTVTTVPINYSDVVTVDATYQNTTIRGRLNILPLQIASFTVNPSNVVGSNQAQGTITLNDPAPTGGAVIWLSSSNPAIATVPTPLTIPAGATSATFTITTNSVTAVTPISLSAMYGNSIQSTTLTVSPDTVTITRAEYSPFKKQLSVQATSNSATSLKVYVTSTGKLIGLLTSNGGSTYSGLFSLSTNPQSITVKSALGGSAIQSLNGSGPSGGGTPPIIKLSSFTLDRNSVTSSNSVQGTVTLSSAPSNDAVVSLFSSNAAAILPESLTVAAGTTSATFTITTGVVAEETSVTVSASYGGLTQSATLNILPPPKAKDTVAIQRAEYTAFSKQLRVQATSTDSTATLQVFTSTGKLLGTLTPDGGGRYSGVFISTSPPSSITVKSSLGGTATKTVK